MAIDDKASLQDVEQAIGALMKASHALQEAMVDAVKGELQTVGNA